MTQQEFFDKIFQQEDLLGTVCKSRKGYVCKLPDVNPNTGKCFNRKFYSKTKAEAIRIRDLYILENEVNVVLPDLINLYEEYQQTKQLGGY